MDYIYLEEDYYKNKKEVFSFLIDILKERIENNYSLLDLGCARGELLYHIKNELPNYTNLFGIDYSYRLIAGAKEQKFLSDINFDIGDAENFSINQPVDFIVCAGVTGFFDSLDKLFYGISTHLNEGGSALILHLFNEFDIDVLVKYRSNQYFNEFQSGWNVHSIQTAKSALEKAGLSLVNTHKFELSFDDPPKDDPARSWTSYVDGEKKFINGLGQVFDLMCLEISK